MYTSYWETTGNRKVEDYFNSSYAWQQSIYYAEDGATVIATYPEPQGSAQLVITDPRKDLESSISGYSGSNTPTIAGGKKKIF